RPPPTSTRPTRPRNWYRPPGCPAGSSRSSVPRTRSSRALRRPSWAPWGSPPSGAGIASLENELPGGAGSSWPASLELPSLPSPPADLSPPGPDRDPSPSPWLPWPSRAVWIGLGAAFAGSLALWALFRRRWSGGGLLDWRAMGPWERGLALVGVTSFLLSFP